MFPHTTYKNDGNTNKYTNSKEPFRVPTESRKKNTGTAVKGRRSDKQRDLRGF